MAAEGLRELRGLAVADAVGDLADRQPVRGEHLGGALHAHGGQVLPEGRPADLRIGTLQLASRRRHAAGDVVEGEVARELVLHDRVRVPHQDGAVMDGRGSLHLPRLRAPPRPGITHARRPRWEATTTFAVGPGPGVDCGRGWQGAERRRAEYAGTRR